MVCLSLLQFPTASLISNSSSPSLDLGEKYPACSISFPWTFTRQRTCLRKLAGAFKDSGVLMSAKIDQNQSIIRICFVQSSFAHVAVETVHIVPLAVVSFLESLLYTIARMNLFTWYSASLSMHLSTLFINIFISWFLSSLASFLN